MSYSLHCIKRKGEKPSSVSNYFLASPFNRVGVNSFPFGVKSKQYVYNLSRLITKYLVPFLPFSKCMTESTISSQWLFSFLIKETTKFGKLSSLLRVVSWLCVEPQVVIWAYGHGMPHHACAGSDSILYPYAVRLRLKPGRYYCCGKFVVIG